MRRSFGGGGGGGTIRSVGRAVRAGVGGAPPEPFSPSGSATTNNIASANSRKAKNLQPTSPNAALTLSSTSSAAVNGTSAFSSVINLPIPATTVASPITCSDELEWECVDHAFVEDYYVFGTVPSKDEVHHAVSALQQVIASSSCICSRKGKFADNTDKDVPFEVANPTGFEKRVSSAKSEMDCVEPSQHLCNLKMLQCHGSNRVYDAFHLLETEPSVQRMVISLSSDKAVWDAVMNNEVVKELKESICQKADGLIEESSNKGSDDSNPIKDILSWIFVNGKARIMQLMDKITKLANEVFQPPNEDKSGDTTNPLERKLKTSLLLSIMVFLVVVISRTRAV